MIEQSVLDVPVPDGDPPPPLMRRRRFFARLSAIGGAVIAVLLGVPVLGFVLQPLVERVPRLWRAVGAVEDFPIGATVEVQLVDASPLPWAGVTARTAAWLRRTGDAEFRAFSVNCSHLGCPVRWVPDAALFMCPCHGGVFYADGRVAAGPPPRPLAEYQVRVRRGQVEILTAPIPIAGKMPDQGQG